MIPVTSAATSQWYNGSIDQGFEPSGMPITFTGNNTFSASWQDTSTGIWDVFLFTLAQYTTWSSLGLLKDNLSVILALSAVEKHLSSNNGSFIVTDLDPSITYRFTIYNREVGPFISINAVLVWANITAEDAGIPGFELIGLLFALTALLVIYLRKKPKPI
ncbi:MAG: hypothetical protein HWN65_12540 [Candidatus Helarchaeota archaeon]|nr:hypothetical protein [Candidatus Helarchaeota archaeon]